MEIRDGKVTITKDDLQAKYKQRLSRTVSEEQIQELEDKLKETDFMTTEKPQKGIAMNGEDKLQSLVIVYGKEMNNITVKNTPPPRSFVEAIATLEDFSRDELHIPPVSLTPEEMQKEGINAYKRAKLLFDNYQAKEENLNLAIKYFGIVLEYLDGFKHLPEYDLAYKYQQEAKHIMKEELQKHTYNLDRYLRLNNLFEAKEECLSVMAKTEPGSAPYKKAKKYLIDIEKNIKKKRK